MALTQVTGPYPIFTDLDGSPLDDGYLFIGSANQDPETNPIQVFWDSNLTIPATQPIRTNNGYAWRNGTPGLLYTAGEFSITIRNKRNEFVLYSPVGYGFDPAAVAASVTKNDFIGDGVEVDFTLSASPSTILATNVFINGVYQEKDSYSLLGNVITFSVAPPLASSIEILTNETGVINTGNANTTSYTAGFPGAVGQTVQTKLEQYVSVKDFGAVGDGVTDDTIAVQAAIDYAQTDGQALYAPAGVYAVSGLTYDGDLPLRLFGDGQSQQSGGSLVETATVFKLTQASARLFDCVSGGNTAVKQFELFSVLNASGGSSETAFYSENGTFTLFKNITGERFQYGIRHQKTVYSHLHYVHFRNCDYAFDYTNITSTPPFVLNDLGANGFYNNVIVFDNCVANTGVIGFKVAGATVTFTTCDATGQSTAGWRIGGSDYNLTVVSLDQAYGENISANVMEITNANVTIGALFIGSNCAKAIVANNSRITVSSLRSYAVVTLGVEATNSYVNVDNYGGTFTTKWSQSGTGQVRFIEDEETNLTSFSINQSQSVTVTCESSTTRIVAVDLLGFENGTTYFGLRIFLRGGNVYVTGNTPSDLDVTSVINGNGNYDLVLTNSAGFAYNFSGYAKPQFIDYTTPIPPGV